MYPTLCVTLGKSLLLPESQVSLLLSHNRLSHIFSPFATKLLRGKKKKLWKVDQQKSTGYKVNQNGFKIPELLF